MAKGQSLQNGSRIGPYSIVRLIGRGGMGEVYEALDENLKRKVALKIISPQFTNDSEITTRFEHEGRTLAKVFHRNLVMIYAFGHEKGVYYIAMEFVEGQSISERLKDGRFRVREAIPLFIEILDAISSLHKMGIIHRDLKPGNIILRADSTVKIVDFGIAKDFGDNPELTRVGDFIGSAHYAAPEIASGEKCSPQSDIFSMGVIFFEMITGKRPFRGKTLMEVLEQVKTKKLKFPSDLRIPDSLKDIISSMCEKSPENRASDIGTLQSELAQILSQEQTISTVRILEPETTTKTAPSSPSDPFPSVPSFKSGTGYRGTYSPRQNLEGFDPELLSALKSSPFEGWGKHLPIAATVGIALGVFAWLYSPKQEAPPAPNPVEKFMLKQEYTQPSAQAPIPSPPKTSGLQSENMRESHENTPSSAEVMKAEVAEQIDLQNSQTEKEPSDTNESETDSYSSIAETNAQSQFRPVDYESAPAKNEPTSSLPSLKANPQEPKPRAVAHNTRTQQRRRAPASESTITAPVENAPSPPILQAAVSIQPEPAIPTPPHQELEQAVKEGLARPTLKFPRSGSIVLTKGASVPIVFLWSPIPEAQNYEIQFSNDKTFSSPFYTTRTASSRFIYNGAFPKKVLYWRVRAANANSHSRWSKIRTLKKSD